MSGANNREADTLVRFISDSKERAQVQMGELELGHVIAHPEEVQLVTEHPLSVSELQHILDQAANYFLRHAPELFTTARPALSWHGFGGSFRVGC